MENVLAKIINALDARRYKHVIVTVSKDLSLSENILTQNTVFHCLKGSSVPERLIELHAVVKEEGINLLHARGWPLMLEGGILSLFLQIPSVYSFHGKTHNWVLSYSKLRRLVEMVSVRMYDAIVTLTPAMKTDLMETLKLSTSRVRLIANGTPEIQLGTEEREKARCELGIDAAAFVVGFAGRFDPVKDLDTVVKGFTRFAAQTPNSRLVLVGDGPCADRLRTQVQECAIGDKVIFTGFSDKVQQVMQAFDVYLQTSLYEGLSNTILEALSVGLPVVCTDVGGNSDIIENGKNGFLIAQRDVEACSASLTELFRSPELRRRMGEKNLEKHKDRYSLQSMTRLYDELYLSCLKYS